MKQKASQIFFQYNLPVATAKIEVFGILRWTAEDDSLRTLFARDQRLAGHEPGHRQGQQDLQKADNDIIVSEAAQKGGVNATKISYLTMTHLKNVLNCLTGTINESIL